MLLMLAPPIASPAHAAPRDPGVLALARTAPVVVIAEVRSVSKEDDRVEIAKLKVREKLKGDDSGTIRVAHRRAFASDPSPFKEDDLVVAALGPLPSDSYWRKRYGEKDLRYLATPRHLRAIPAADAARWREALAQQVALDLQGAPGAALARFYLVQAALPPAPLASDALRALGALPDLAPALGAREFEALAARLRDPTIDLAAKKDLVAKLAERKVLGAADLLLSLAREDAALRTDALAALASLSRDSQEVRAAALAGLEAWMADSDPAVRKAAVALLAASLDDESIPRLKTVATADVDDDVAVAAVDGLAALGGDDPRFYEALGDASLRARKRPAVRAIGALAKANTAKSVETIGKLFADERYDVQAVAVIALTNVRAPGATETIRRVYETTPSPQLKKAIERILSKSGM